jgi:hypothetical protein
MTENTVAGTPGPWIVEEHKNPQYPDLPTFDVVAPKGWQEPSGEYKVCGVASGLDSREDAHLIAAAPELLDLLTGVLDSQEANGYVGVQLVADIRAAITKAEGRRTMAYPVRPAHFRGPEGLPVPDGN